MSKTVTNYDGSVSSAPQQLAPPASVEELRTADPDRRMVSPFFAELPA